MDRSSRRNSTTSFNDPTTPTKTSDKGGAETSLRNVENSGVVTSLRNGENGRVGTSLRNGTETQPLLRRALLREDGMRTPNRESYHPLKQRANTDLRRRNEIPTLRQVS